MLYDLVKSVKETLPFVIKQFEIYIKQRGEMLIKISGPGPEGPKSADEFVNLIMDFHAKYIRLIEQIFEGNSKFIRVLDQTCITVINHNPEKKTHCPSIDWVRYLFVLLFYLYKIFLIVLILFFVFYS